MGETLSITFLLPHNPFSTSVIFGAELSSADLAIELAHRGHDVSVVHSYVAQSNHRIVDGVSVYGERNAPFPFVAGWTANLVIARLIENLSSCRKTDVLDVRGSGLGWAFARAAPFFECQVFHVVDVAVAEWRSLPIRARVRRAPLYAMLAYNERLCMEAAELAVTETQAIGREIESRYQKKAPAWTVIPPMIPRTWVPSGDGVYDPSHFVFIGAGPRRDTLLFLRALRLLMDRGVAARATVFREYRPRMHEIAAHWGLKVQFRSGASSSEMATVFRSACALVLPSHREAFCRSVTEAAVNGAPSIVSDLAAVREFVIHAQTGIVIPSWNPFDWADAMQRLKEDSELRHHLGAAAQRAALSRFSPDRVARLTEQAYRQLLSPAAPSGLRTLSPVQPSGRSPDR